MDALVSAYETVAKYGLPFVFFLIGLGSYRKKWVWTHIVEKREAELLADISKLEDRNSRLEEKNEKLQERLLIGAEILEKSARRVAR